MEEIRMIELFSGYGAQHLAMKRLQKDYPFFKYKAVAYADIDKYAIKAYKALHGDNIPNLGDVSIVDYDKCGIDGCDLIFYSWPCTDISQAGKQKGFDEGSGTRSSMLWESRRAIIHFMPKYCIMENVEGLLSEKFLPIFKKWFDEMGSYGYTNYYKILNAKDYGVPQNRRRVFMVSILDNKKPFYFPKPIKLTKKLSDVLEQHPSEKLYISADLVEKLNIMSYKVNPSIVAMRGRGEGENYSQKIEIGSSETSNTITTVGKDNLILEPIVLGWSRPNNDEGVVTYHKVEVANCVTASRRENTMNFVVQGYRIRKLSDRELYRLMDVEEKDIDILLNCGIAKSQHQKLSGNSICVGVLYYLFKSLFIDIEPEEGQQLTLF